MHRQIKVAELREALTGMPLDAPVVFQGNVQGEEDAEGEYTYTTSTGFVWSAFHNGTECVIDCAITDSES